MATEVTGRDKVWNAVLTALSRKDEVYIVKADIDDVDPDIGRMTRLRTLWAMTDLKVLRKSDNHDRWYKGDNFDGVACYGGDE